MYGGSLGRVYGKFGDSCEGRRQRRAQTTQDAGGRGGAEVENLVSRPELNGLQASLVEFNSTSGRYQVEICSKKSSKKSKADPIVVALKPANMLLPVGTRVRIQGLLKTPKFNGMWGMVIGLAMTADQKSVDTTRYAVQISQQSVLNLKRENCFP